MILTKITYRAYDFNQNNLHRAYDFNQNNL